MAANPQNTLRTFLLSFDYDTALYVCTLWLQSVLRIGSAHNKGGIPNINIAQISHFLNSFWIETLAYIHLQT